MGKFLESEKNNQIAFKASIQRFGLCFIIQ